MIDRREELARLLEASAGQPPRTPAERLRVLLTELEIRVANLAGTGEEVMRIPALMDQVIALLDELRTLGVDVTPEETRFQTVQGLLRQKAGQFVREARQAGGLKEARARAQPPPDHWWWYLDQVVTQQRRQAVKRALLIFLGLAGIIALVIWFVQQQLPQDPRLRRTIDLEQEMETAMMEGRWEDVLNLLAELEALNPDDPGYLLQRGVILERLDRRQEAQQVYEQARRSMGEVQFYVQRSAFYLDVGLYESALADAQQAVSLDPENAQAHFYLGSAYEASGNIREALAVYEKAAALAEAQGQAQLVAIIRVRMAYMLQRVPLPSPAPTTEP